ncbi:MAG TPA: hypothetical protein VEY92_08335 [Pseudoxanthomonas sp.]|nr:hypothetical protein [Pseudoxanthomonas sp.]
MNETSRLQPGNPAPKLVMLAVPVTLTRSASADPISVVEAAAMVKLDTALVLRMIEACARR